MKPSLGRIHAALADPAEAYPDKFVAMINERVRPAEKLTAADVHIRAMYVVSDAVNSFGGCFQVDEHERLASLLIDTPVMIGHRKDKLPIGRTFHAERAMRDGRPWVKAYFYWLSDTDGAEDLKENIDGGVYRECSISFTFTMPECSVCGRDIRTCEHEPFQVYRQYGREHTCHFNYRRLDRVLETTLVYRGAVPGTAITRDLSADRECGCLTGSDHLESLTDLDPTLRYVVVPRYSGLPVTVEVQANQLQVHRLDGTLVDSTLTPLPEDCSLAPGTRLHAILVGHQGKKRCSLAQLERYLAGRSSAMSRLVLFAMPHQGLEDFKETGGDKLSIRKLPYREAGLDDLYAKASEITTAQGVEVHALGSDPFETEYHWFHPEQLSAPKMQTTVEIDGSETILRVAFGKQRRFFSLSAIDGDALRSGTGYFVKPCESPVATFTGKLIDATVLRESNNAGETPTGLALSIAEVDSQMFALRPVTIGGQERPCLHRIPLSADALRTSTQN